MKCNKCGFISFDYLSECRKCGTSLSGCRDALGFSAARSNVPFFLGSLLKDYVKPSAADEQNLTAADSTSSFDFGFGEELGLDGDSDTVVQAAAAGPEHAALAPEVLETEDFSLLDISDEELGLLVVDDEDGPAPGPASGPASPGVASQSAHVMGGGEAASLTGGNAGATPGPAGGTVVPVGNTGAAQEDAGDDNLVIELSDNDLENFLSELDDPSERGDSAAASKRGAD